MSATTISSRSFNQNPSRAKREAVAGPVIITDHGVPSFVLLRYDAWKQNAVATPRRSLLDVLRADDDITFEPPRFDGGFTPADFG